MTLEEGRQAVCFKMFKARGSGPSTALTDMEYIYWTTQDT